MAPGATNPAFRCGSCEAERQAAISATTHLLGTLRLVPPTVARPSLASLLLQPSFGGNPISSATGFVAPQPNGGYFLVTNWHVVTGRNPITGQPLNPQTGAVPDQIVIAHHVEDALGTWHPVVEPLYSPAGAPRWLEHPTLGRRVDVVALPLTETTGSAFIGYDPRQEGVPIKYGVSRPLSIIGFPYGRTGGGLLGIWTQGYVATEPELDFDDLPLFLIDARTRGGQSGSPVIAYADGGMVTSDNGDSGVYSGPVERFIGVYSGRIIDPADPQPSTDLGFVWKRRAVEEITEGGVPGSI